MKHLLTILDIEHVHKGDVVWRAENLTNVLHKQGEEFILSCLFKSATVSPPTFYYLGLDNRSNPVDTDMIDSLQSEPTANGYARQPVSSGSGFTVAEVDGVIRATSIVVSFTASGGSWGPIKNLFLTDEISSSGYLIATAPLGDDRTLASGDTLTMRFALALSNVS
jgi:hypothetical protein